MINSKTIKKQIGYGLVCSILMLVLMSMLTLNVQAASYSDFSIGDTPLTSEGGTGSHYTYDSTTETLTITGKINGDVRYNGSGTGNVVVEFKASVMNSIHVNGDVTVNGVVSGFVDTTGSVNVGFYGKIYTIYAYGDTTIDKDGRIITSKFNIPLSAIMHNIYVFDGDLNVASSVTQDVLQRILYMNSSDSLKFTVQSSGELKGTIELLDNTNVDVKTGGVVSGKLQIAQHDTTININGDVSGGIEFIGSDNATVNYQSGILTGDISSSSYAEDNTIAIGVDAIVTGSIDANGDITIDGTVGGSATSSMGNVTINTTGMVNANSVGISILGNAVMGNVYYPITTMNTVDKMQASAPSNGYIRITSNGKKNIVEINNIGTYLYGEGNYISAVDSGLPLEIYAVGTGNSINGILHNLPITMTAVLGGDLTSNINTSDVFTLQNGMLYATPDLYGFAGTPVVHGINADSIIINGGELKARGDYNSSSIYPQSAAFSTKPIINPPSGMVARIMVSSEYDSVSMEEVAESSDYHLNNMVQISFSVPTPPTTQPGEDASILSGLKIVNTPSKTLYETGQALNLTGIQVNAVYEDGSIYSVDPSELTVSGFNRNQTGVQTITVNYAGLTSTFSITVEDANEDTTEDTQEETTDDTVEDTTNDTTDNTEDEGVTETPTTDDSTDTETPTEPTTEEVVPTDEESGNTSLLLMGGIAAIVILGVVFFVVRKKKD